MVKPHIKLKAGRVHAEAFIASSQSHEDMRRWHPHPGSADADLIPELGRITSRSRDLARNHGIADSARQTQLDNIVGTGLRLSAKPQWKLLKGRDRKWAEEWGNGVEALFQEWWGSTACDAANSLTGDSLTAQVWNSRFLNGEACALPLWLPRPGARFATRLQLVEPDRLSNPNDRPNTDRLRGGVEIDEYGAPQGYWFRRAHPGDVYFQAGQLASQFDRNVWERVPAYTSWGRKRVIHAHDKDRIGQSRGIPALTAVMRPFKVLGDYTNSELKAAAANALVAIVLESNLTQESIVELLGGNPDALKTYQEGLAQRKASAINFQGAQILPIPLGDKATSFAPARPAAAFDPFVTMFLRHIAAGLHMPYELLLKDFSKTNYSSARAALLEAWRFFRGRRKWLATYFLTAVYCLFLEEAVMQGLVDAPDFYENYGAYTRCFWIGDGRGWIDPLKEAQAADLRMSKNLSTLEAECAEQGLDWEEVLEQRARELLRQQELENEYGIKFPAAGTAKYPLDDKDEVPGAPGEDRDNPAKAPAPAAAAA